MNPDKKIKRSREMTEAAYFLAAFATPGSDGKHPTPPTELGDISWKNAYARFFANLNDGRSFQTFADSLNAQRRYFDAFLPTQPTGWKQAGASQPPTELSKKLKRIFDALEAMNRKQVWKRVSKNVSYDDSEQFEEINFEGIEQELSRRDSIWHGLVESGEADETSAGRVRELGIYSGARGMYADKSRTRSASGDTFGITVSVLHTGQYYDDDLSDSELLYHYPSTKSAGYDTSDIEATKNAKRYSVPIFVVSLPAPKSRIRKVRRGWVEDWDDEHRVFLISFSNIPPPASDTDEDEEDFSLTGDNKGKKKTQTTTARPNQQKFAFDVFKRYGKQCAICGVKGDGLIDAAHIRGKAHNGSDYALNGIPLCALHHRALDNFYIGIEPESLKIVCGNKLGSLKDLLIQQGSISSLRAKPHPTALEWLWNKFQDKQ